VPLDKQQTPPPSHHRHDLGARVSRCCDQLSCNRLCAQLLGTGSPRALEVGRRREARPHFSLRRYSWKLMRSPPLILQHDRPSMLSWGDQALCTRSA
jgi:hypothetical protein